MKTCPSIEKLIYLAIILISLVILVLATISPSQFLDVSAVYQGF